MRCSIALTALIISIILPAAGRADPVAKNIELLQSGDPLKKRAAATALGKTGSPEALTPLIKALVDDDHFVRSMAARALGSLGDRRAVPALISLLQDTQDKVRSAALLALAKLKDPRSVPALVKELKLGQEAAAVALGQMKARKALKPLAYVMLWKAASKEVRCKSAWALGQLGHKQAIKPLVKALAIEDRAMRAAAADALVELDKVAVKQLIALAKTQKHANHEGIIVILGEIGDARAVPALMVAAGHKDPKVRAAALTAAAAIDGAGAEVELVRGLGDKDVVVRRAAVAGLARECTTAAIGPLSKVVKKDKDTAVRRLAVTALGKLADRRGLPALVHALQKDPDADARFAAVTAMYRVRHRGMIPALKAAQLDKDQRVKEAAAKLLVEMLK